MKKAFVAYAGEDEDMVHRLLTHLTSLKREEILETWFDGEILAGEKWEKRIFEELDSSDIVILCLSADFLASEYAQTVEVPRALARHDAGECIIIPIQLTPCNWKVHEKIKELQIIPRRGKAVSQYNDGEEAWAKVIGEIVKATKPALYRTDASFTAALREARLRRSQQDRGGHGTAESPGHTTITVRSAGAELAEVDILALSLNHTWKRAKTDAQGKAHLRLRSSRKPKTFFAAAPGYTACIERYRIPAERPLALEVNPLPGGGAVIFPNATGTLPGLEGRLNPIRDSLDRSYLYADNIAINDGQPQPVSFGFGEELRLTDASGNERWVRIVYIAGRSALVEYRLRPSAAAEK